jgi:hypothetical protein
MSPDGGFIAVAQDYEGEVVLSDSRGNVQWRRDSGLWDFASIDIWARIPAMANHALRAVAFHSDDDFVVVGAHGTVLHSVDGLSRQPRVSRGAAVGYGKTVVGSEVILSSTDP